MALTDHIHLDAEAQAALFREARTANTFMDEPVTAEQFEALYDLVKWAPTALNTQPLRVLFVQSPEARARLVAHMSGNNAPKTSTAPAVAVLAADVDFHEHLPRLVPYNPAAKDGFADAARREAFARSQAWLQAGYFIVGVRALGLAAGPMAGFNAAGVDEEFFAGTPLKSFLVVNIGKPGPDAWKDRLPRLDYNEVVTIV